MIITRKIQINPVGTPEEKKGYWDTLFSWQRNTFQLANLISSHRFIQDNLIRMIYLEEGVKRKLGDHAKDELGIFNCSNLHSTGKMSQSFTDLPGDIRGSVNQYVSGYYNKEKEAYYTGDRSLRNYKKTLPVPFSARCIRKLRWNPEAKNFEFTLFGIPFKTYLGTDRSNNRIMLERCLDGEYKICGSSIQLGENKTMLLLKMEIPAKKIQLDPGNVTYALLGIDNPIIAINGGNKEQAVKIISSIEKKGYYIGTKEEFLYQKMRIQETLKKMLQAAKYNKGGRGYKRKVQSIDRLKGKEANYVNTKLHTYARLLVEYAKRNRSHKLILIKQEIRDSNINEEELAVLGNWSHYGLEEKVRYKAAFYGIDIEIIQ
ncbi:hypothetical protein M2451_003845 [Dysgonomonas sp. PFB1-18]|uniref:hypothetical protein n=1 Tax=unclassified Dysgonomonas TaxID=2630389 RepID=UPI002477242D|nr:MULTISPECIES: hypothetical protein [unclassified Dysgonomonas]MDL2303367.1 hypothetical protein [Dysgonomonas sp. OttesenSCG-928-D17]MDH6309473.1 hypothetical protein [Dysgonomonas sp. PF1-14]MDH6340883.1 hypothetical protein [Dysgonomonas sp. PF1-16]MDH6382504.1 hypothetical protein [Dysgonomonas sp. PFB1-18]MDH6399852.1 hypothetical protein [Dysgonomonas sp. PF1-23]